MKLKHALVVLGWVLVLLAVPSQALFEEIVDAITGMASGQATKIEQLTQITNQLEQLAAMKAQTDLLIKESQQFRGDNAWRAASHVRRLIQRVENINRYGQHLAADAGLIEQRLEELAPDAEVYNQPMTNAERQALREAQAILNNQALRDSLKVTMQTTASVRTQLGDVSDDMSRIERDLSSTDSQLAALQLIGEAITQQGQQLALLNTAMTAQTELLANVYARELAQVEQTILGESPDIKVVSKQEADALRAQGKRVEPPAEAIREMFKP